MHGRTRFVIVDFAWVIMAAHYEMADSGEIVPDVRAAPPRLAQAFG